MATTTTTSPAQLLQQLLHLVVTVVLLLRLQAQVSLLSALLTYACICKRMCTIGALNLQQSLLLHMVLLRPVDKTMQSCFAQNPALQHVPAANAPCFKLLMVQAPYRVFHCQWKL